MQADGITSAKARKQEREARSLEFAGGEEPGVRRRGWSRKQGSAQEAHYQPLRLRGLTFNGNERVRESCKKLTLPMWGMAAGGGECNQLCLVELSVVPISPASYHQQSVSVESNRITSNS